MKYEITCSICGKPAARIKSFLVDGEMQDVCAKCLGISESGGVKTSGILTRGAFRIRSEAVKHEGDTLPAHVYDKMSRKMVPNPDFANRFTNNAEQFYTESEAKKQGMPKLAEHITTLKKNKIEHKKKERAKALFEGNQTAGVKKQLDKLGIKK